MPIQLKITTQDIRILQNCSDGYARRVIRLIKAHFKKNKNQFITPREYAIFFGLEIWEVYHSLGWEIPEHLKHNIN